MDVDQQRIEEYKVLHIKIDETKRRRYALFSLTTGIYIGALAGVFAVQLTSGTQVASEIQLVFLCVVYLLISFSIYLMRSNQIYMRGLINYIRNNIEPNMQGLNYATFTHKKLSARANKGGLKSFGYYYLALSLLPYCFYLFYPAIPSMLIAHVFISAPAIWLAIGLAFGCAAEKRV